MTKDEALKLALEALELALSDNQPYIVKCGKAITAIKEALAQPVQEPVAREQFHEHMAGSFYKPPPQRPWVGLTETDILAASRHWRHAEDFMAGVYWAAGTLKEKNT